MRRGAGVAGCGDHGDVADVALGLGDPAAVGDEHHVADGECGLDGGAVGVDALVVRAVRAVGERGGVVVAGGGSDCLC